MERRRFSPSLTTSRNQSHLGCSHAKSVRWAVHDGLNSETEEYSTSAIHCPFRIGRLYPTIVSEAMLACGVHANAAECGM